MNSPVEVQFLLRTEFPAIVKFLRLLAQGRPVDFGTRAHEAAQIGIEERLVGTIPDRLEMAQAGGETMVTALPQFLHLMAVCGDKGGKEKKVDDKYIAQISSWEESNSGDILNGQLLIVQLEVYSESYSTPHTPNKKVLTVEEPLNTS